MTSKTQLPPPPPQFNLRRTPAVLLTLIFFFFTAGIGMVFAQQASEGGFNYGWDKNVKDGIEITKYVGDQTDVRIPSTIQNYKVTSIGSGAFRGNRKITSVTIPNSVTLIDGGMTSGAFSGCTSLTSVTIPNGVTSIGNNVFNGCTSLTSVTIPNSVTSIGNSAFLGCSSLARINIPNNVTSIGRDAFRDCSSLASVTIPRSVTSIGVTAFKDCTNLTSVTFQGTISSSDFGVMGRTITTADLFPGDLPDKYLAREGGPGTYIRFANGKEWRKQ
ncbi:MAG: leucine-rich repeat domain-containing protein [Treponema sp.]|nr:leucine-rich repeat domain-containing protein [Treponema sp.]